MWTVGILSRIARARGRLGLGGAGPLALRPAGDVPLRAAGDRECARRDVTAYDAAGARGGSVAHRHRRDEGVVARRPGVRADRGAMLLDPVVVGEDRAGADVRALAD